MRIIIEGPKGCGKTTVAKAVAEYLLDLGWSVAADHEKLTAEERDANDYHLAELASADPVHDPVQIIERQTDE